LLPEAGYKMLSRDEGSSPRAVGAPVPEFDICLDLHTSKTGARLSAKEIFRELARRNEAGHECSGVMLHHCRMTDEDFQTLDELLKDLSKRCIPTNFFSDMVPGMGRTRDIEVTHV